ncbi:MAG: MFS transporter, partial [Christensenellaceae bacterium]|nr:MFS transporter [Christensenellaceae bacterium]
TEADFEKEAENPTELPEDRYSLKRIWGRITGKNDNPDGFKMTKEEKNWALYDAGNSAIYAFFILISVCIGELAHNVPYFGEHPTQTMSLFNSVSGGIIAIMGPIMGALADNKGTKKRLFKLFVGLGLVGGFGGLLPTIAWATGSDIGYFIPFTMCMLLVLIGLGGSLMFYDSMLADVTTELRSDKVSGKGYSYGYSLSLIPFFVCLGLFYFFMDPEYNIREYGWSEQNAYFSLRLIIAGSIALCSVWWLVFTRPLLKTYVQKTGVDPVPHQIKNAFIKLAKTFKEIRKYKAAFYFMLAFFFFINGVNTIFSLSATYAKETLLLTIPHSTNALDILVFGENATADTMTSMVNVLLVVVFVITQLIASAFSGVFANLAKKFGARNMIFLSIVGFMAVTIYGVFMATVLDLFFVALGIGLFLGGIQALSRSYFARLAPQEKQGEFFGLFDVFNKSSNFLGSAIFTITVSASMGFLGNDGITYGGNHVFAPNQMALSVVLLFFITGFVLLCIVPRTKADLTYSNIVHKKKTKDERIAIREAKREERANKD